MSGTTTSTRKRTSSTSWSAACARRSINHSTRSCCRPSEVSGMSSDSRTGLEGGESVYEGRAPHAGAFGLRLALWYATLFVLGSIAIVSVTYYLTATSLAQRDRQILQGKLGDYTAAYVRGAIDVLANTVRIEQRAAPERLFVRVVDRGVEAVVLSDSEGWDPARLETASVRLADGTLVQVGKSTEAREALLARFRAALGLVTLSIVVIALTGGWL